MNVAEMGQKNKTAEPQIILFGNLKDGDQSEIIFIVNVNVCSYQTTDN